MNTLHQLDLLLLKTINGWHTPWADLLMWQVSGTLIWIPLYAFFLYVLIKAFKKQSFVILIGVILLITSTDQTTNLIKHSKARLRPSHQQELSQELHYVNEYRGGKYSFPSGHAANTMGIALFLTLLLGRQYSSLRWIPIPWSLFVGFSRVYLGVHFPSDVLAGFLLGALWGYIWYRLILFALSRLSKEKTEAQHE
ncbi:MAG: phosphatase PAP2 family protein [Bacteroidales bacterium]|jgi:undecaprenyl-diphosphatase|nr:phosphatase PAP2 family protein [Bacteroidales bacterium]NPV35651.1 phosphatase PAP2 family protein [Bacteroidales bacterium]